MATDWTHVKARRAQPLPVQIMPAYDQPAVAFFSGVMTIGHVPAFLLNHHAAEALGYPTAAKLWMMRQGPSLLDIGLEPASDLSDGALAVRPTWEHEGTAEVWRQHRAKWPLAVYVEGVLAMRDVPEFVLQQARPAVMDRGRLTFAVACKPDGILGRP